MQKSCRNIYKTCREVAGFTQEHAAELLAISTRTLADYETGKRIPGDDLVCNMVEIYETDWLGYQHLKQTEVGRKYLPEIECSDLAKSVLKLQKEVNDLQLVSPDMIAIACDGVVEGCKEERWNRVVEEINDMAGAALAVVFSR